MSAYWKNWPSIKVLDFLKDVWNVENSNLEPKKKLVLVLQMFSDVTFHQETISTNMTYTTLYMWLFMWKRQLRHSNVKSVRTISRKTRIRKHVQKKDLVFLVPFRWFQHFKHLLKNLKLKLMAILFINHSLDLYFFKSLGP